MRFGVLGPLAVWTSVGEPLTVPGLKVRALLADLLVHAGQPVSADRLVDDLWGEHPPADPAGALQAKVSQLRRALEAAEPGGRDLVEYRPAGYLLRAEGDTVDANRFQDLMSRVRDAGDPRARAAPLAEALGLWRGDAFADFGDQLFAQASIARLEEERLAALEEQAEARLELGEHAQLVGELTALVARHPLRERLRAAQLKALYRAGRPSEALDSYRELAGRLAEELGLDPSPELAALQQAILTQDPVLQAPPLATAAPPRTNLPAPMGSLIGRTGAVAEVRARLASGRLVTLTGPGGVGKTRLAVETAAQQAGEFSDGAWLVELAALAGAMTWYWFLRGRLTEARRALEGALAIDGEAPGPARAFATAWQAGITLLAGGGGDPAEDARTALQAYRGIDDPGGQAEAEWFLGFATSDFGDLPPSEDLVDRALSAFRALGDRWGIAAAMSTRAKHAAARGDLATVSDSGRQSLELFREIGDRWGQLQATEWLGARCEIIGEYEHSWRLHADGLQMAEELGLWPQVADRLSWLGRIAMLTGDHAQARELLEEARRLAAERAYKPGEVFAEISLGTLARREGKLDMADEHLRTVLGWHQQMGYAPDVGKAMVLVELGFAAEQRGDPVAAQRFHAEALAIARKLGDPRGIAVALEGLAGAQAIAGHYREAATLLGTAAAIRQSEQAPLSAAEHVDTERIDSAVRAALGEDAFADRQRRGAQLRLDDASLASVIGPAA